MIGLGYVRAGPIANSSKSKRYFNLGQFWYFLPLLVLLMTVIVVGLVAELGVGVGGVALVELLVQLW